MNEIFCDTLYFKALVDRKDQYHDQALKLTANLEAASLITTQDIFVEALNFVSGYGPTIREAMTKLLTSFLLLPNALVIDRSRSLFNKGWELYRQRNDKQYSLTDCISMVVMKERGLQRILTNDVHFQQEGFQVLFCRL